MVAPPLSLLAVAAAAALANAQASPAASPAASEAGAAAGAASGAATPAASDAAGAATPTAVPNPSTVATAVTGETPLPLTDYQIPYSAIPYQVNPYQYLRGPQSGYNLCNSTTEGPDSQCQTAVFNSIEDFCIWGGPGTDGKDTIGVVEAAVVAYCSRSGHGARIFPEGTFKSIQFIRTPAYIQIVGYLNQTIGLNLAADDTGGELDPHGADLLGNPLGGLYYSTGFANGDNKTYVQTQSWNNFVGDNMFCLKLCDPSYSTDKNYCQNIYDLLGCSYNMPSDYAALSQGNMFVACEGDLQDEVGTYTSGGQTLTWSQPESLNPSSTLPWTPRIPASSNCVTYQSTDLFPIASLGYQSAAAVSSQSAASASATGSGASGSAATGSGSPSRSGSGAAGASATAKSGAIAVAASPLAVVVAALACLAL